MRIGIYPGSFDPVTLGHLDIIKRSSKLVDKLIIGVLNNSAKNPLFTTEERVFMLQEVIKDLPNNIEVEAFNGLTVEFAKMKKAEVIIRGLRAVTDFEYELQIAQTNHKINPTIDSVFLTTSVEYAYLSSSIVREIARYGGDIRGFVPNAIVDCVYDKYHINDKNQI